VIARNQVRNTTAPASRWLRLSSSFMPENSISSMIPGVRPNRARYSSQIPTMPSIATAMISQREGSTLRFQSAAARQA